MSLLKAALALALFATGLAAPIPKGKDKLARSMTSTSGLTNKVQFRLHDSVMPPTPSSLTDDQLSTNANMALEKAASVISAAISAPTTGTFSTAASLACDSSTLERVFRAAGEYPTRPVLPDPAYASPWARGTPPAASLRSSRCCHPCCRPRSRPHSRPHSHPHSRPSSVSATAALTRVCPPPRQASLRRSTRPPACTW